MVSLVMASIEDILASMRRNPKGVRFADLCKVCDHFLASHASKEVAIVFTECPWQGDPRVNIQNQKGKAKAYQVRQVLKAIDRLRDNQ